MLYCLRVSQRPRERFNLGKEKLAIGGGNGIQAALTQGMGTVLDLTDRGLGVQSIRYSMIVEDGTVTQNLEEGGVRAQRRGYFPLVALNPRIWRHPMENSASGRGYCAMLTPVYCVATVCSSMTLTCRARHMPSSCVPPMPMPISLE